MSVKTKGEILKLARSVIRQEMEALDRLQHSLDQEFYEAVHWIHKSNGKVIVTGMGKSAIIGQKIAATLNSTGTTSVFMHAADAAHGDLGVINQEDTLIILSKSGETDEIKALLPMIRSLKVKTIAMVGVKGSFLDRRADISLYIPNLDEADPHNLAPTTSTASQLAMGDALAITLLELKGFTRDQFATLHPGGNLGKKLLLTVEDICHDNPVPAVTIDTPIKNVIVEITSKRLGVTAVLDDNNNLAGVITDGDLRRMLSKDLSLEGISAQQIMTHDPRTILLTAKAVEALSLMRQNSITQLLIVDLDGKYQGVIHIHDLIREGIM